MAEPDTTRISAIHSAPFEQLHEVNPLIEADAIDTIGRVESVLAFLSDAATTRDRSDGFENGFSTVLELCQQTLTHATKQLQAARAVR